MSRSQPDPIERLKSVPNPFVRDVVGSPLDEAKADVPKINRYPFEKCVKLVNHVSAQRESSSVLLFGEPGSGKTHLLSRLREHLDRDNEAGLRNIFIPLRMQTSASMVWRFVRANLADALTRRLKNGSMVLERILDQKRHEIASMPNRDLGIVFEHLLEGRHVRDATAWLRGYELPESALKDMGLSSQPIDEEFQEERARELIHDVAQLASPIPMVFCLDQVEALQRHAEDKEGIFALGKLVATLHDALHNSAIISCVQTSFMDQIKGAVRGSEQDRLLANRAGILALTWDQALELVQARLDSQPALAEIRPRTADRYWPLNLDKLRPVFDSSGICVARKVLHRAKELFEEATYGVKSLPEPLDDYLGRLYAERFRIRPPQDSDFILRDALPELFLALGMQPRPDGGSRTGAFDLMVEHDGRPAAFALCNQRPGVGLVNRFRKLGEKWDAGYAPRLVMLRDARLGISPTARASQQRLEELQDRRAEFVSVTPEALAALDAIRSLLADADSGDLSHNGESVSRNTVERWISSHLPAALDDLVDQLRGHANANSALVPALTAYLNERKIVSMEDAARDLKVGLKEVADCVHQNPHQFAALEGRGAVLFQPVRQPLAG